MQIISFVRGVSHWKLLKTRRTYIACLCLFNVPEKQFELVFGKDRSHFYLDQWASNKVQRRFWLSQLGGVTDMQRVEARNTAKHSTEHGTASQ